MSGTGKAIHTRILSLCLNAQVVPNRAFGTVTSDHVLRLDSVAFLGATVFNGRDNKFTELCALIRGLEHKGRRWRKVSPVQH